MGKIAGLSIKTEATHIESYVKRSLAALAQAKEKMNTFMRQSIHEIRSVNTDVYNAVYALRENLKDGRYDHIRDYTIVRNIEELSQFLRTRTSVLDVVSNPSLLAANKSMIPIYRAVDRIVKNLQPTAKSVRVNLEIIGSSQRRVLGVSLFDVIPYLVIHNALKYAPRDSSVTVKVWEEGDEAHMSVESLGPQVNTQEMEMVFLSGFRGKNAAEVTEGTGTGLYIVKLLVEMHAGGEIQFNQEPSSREENGIPYGITEVTVRMDLAD